MNRCEGCERSDDLSLHHIIPKKVRRDDSPDNLAVLCLDCHALIERYYWRVMAKRKPKVARALLLADQQFGKRSHSTSEDRQLAQDVQGWAWGELTEGICWQYLYQEALAWSRTITPTRKVDPGQAIHTRPWWKPKTT